MHMQAYLVLAIIFFGMILLEKSFPGQDFEETPHWWQRAIFLNAMHLLATLFTGYIWNKWFNSYTIFNAREALGTTGCVIISYLIITFVFYWWHRMRHDVDFCWVYLHQLHHSPKRLEVLTSFYKHPLEMFVDGLLTSFILFTLLGSPPETASITIALAGIAEIFYHSNIKTPYWLGYFFQRPEMHLVHHKLSWHHNNYSDLPIWDMIFGTYNNPKEFKSKCGFKDNRETRIWEMLRFVEVNEQSNKNMITMEQNKV